MNLGNNIAELRRQTGLTQEQLAEKCEVSRQAVTKWEAGISEPSIEKLIKLAQLFQVSMDELITGKNIEMQVSSHRDINYINIAACIADLELHFKSEELTKQSILSNLMLLYEFMQYRYIDADGKVYETYLVKNTTKKERERYVALINHYESFKKYVNGELEIDQAIEDALEEICAKSNQIQETYEAIRESKEGKLYQRFKEIAGRIEVIEILKKLDKETLDMETELNEWMETMHLEVAEYGADTTFGRFLRFLENEVALVYENKNIDKVGELKSVLNHLRYFSWSQITIDEKLQQIRLL